jgi:maltose alpha-D-glucosyltransferase/alpha-amylase
MIDIRKRHRVFALGEYHELNSSNPSVLAFVREYRASDPEGTADRMLCVNNLSRFPQPVELDLSRFVESVPVETMGGVEFPRIGELPYLLTLPGYSFYWLTLRAPTTYGP